MFTQTLRNTLLSGGESLDLDETWESPSLPPGRYTARGSGSPFMNTSFGTNS